MNLANWIKLREWLEKQPDERWKMETYACGTAYCLAGHAALMDGWKANKLHDARFNDCHEVGEEVLGMDEDESAHAFFGNWIDKEWQDITKADALRYLDAAIAAQDPMVYLDSETVSQ